MSGTQPPASGGADGQRSSAPPVRPDPTRHATLRQVAEAAGVDPSTASRALRPNTRGLVHPATVQRVMATAEALGYRANPLARGLKNQKSSMTIGMLVPDLANPLFPPIVRGIEDGLRSEGYALVLGNTDGDEARERELVSVLSERRVDGLVLATAQREYPLLDELHDKGLATVLVNRTADRPDVAAVTSDDHLGIGLAVRHLAELGHTEIAHVGGTLSVSTGFLRYQYFLAWMQSLQMPADPDLIVLADWFSKGLGEKACNELLDRGKHFTAIVAGNDLIALGCYAALRARGLRVPEDVSVVGYNGSRWCDDFCPPLTSIHVPKYNIGLRAAELVIQLIDSPEVAPGRVLLPTTLQVRSSTSPAAS